MPLIKITLDDLVTIGKSALIGNTTAPLSLPDGDPLLALVQSNALADLLVAQNIQVLATLLRASTSVGVDLDSWFADFGFTRLPAVAASGVVTFSIKLAGAIIPVGALVSSVNSTAIYNVVADATNPHFDSINNRYVLPTMSINYTVDLPVAATSAGTMSNVGPNSLTNLNTAITNVTGVTNNIAIMNGRDIETDAAARQRFQVFLQSLGKATEGAIVGAIQSILGSNADFILLESTDKEGNAHPNYFTVVAENGSGTLSPSEINQLTEAINAVKGFTIGFDITTPTVVQVEVITTVLFDDSLLTSKNDALAQITVNVTNLVNGKKIGETLYYSEVIAAIMKLQPIFPVIHAVDAVLFNVGGVPTANADLLAPTPTSVFRLQDSGIFDVNIHLASLVQ